MVAAVRLPHGLDSRVNGRDNPRPEYTMQLRFVDGTWSLWRPNPNTGLAGPRWRHAADVSRETAAMLIDAVGGTTVDVVETNYTGWLEAYERHTAERARREIQREQERVLEVRRARDRARRRA